MNTETDRISKFYYSEFRPDIEHYSYMFIEDFYGHIVPISVSRNLNIKCYLLPENKNLEKILSEMLPSMYSHWRNDFKKSILDACEYIAAELAHKGQIIFEFVKKKDINGVVTYRLEKIYGEEIQITTDKVIQKIPKDISNELSIPETIIIPKSKCYIIDFPQSLGGQKDYLKFLKELRKFGEQSPLLNFQNILKNKQDYDYIEHQKIYELELFKLTNKYGWHQRDNTNKLFSSYHYVYRHLKFKKSKIILRDYIIENLKKIISDISAKLGERVELRIEGLMQLKELDEVMEGWESGKIKPDLISTVL